MVDLTYGPNTGKWDETKKPELIERFNNKLEELRLTSKIRFELTEAPASITGFIPYIDGTFVQGALIRNIKDMSMEEENILRASLDEIYYDIMR